MCAKEAWNINLLKDMFLCPLEQKMSTIPQRLTSTDKHGSDAIPGIWTLWCVFCIWALKGIPLICIFFQLFLVTFYPERYRETKLRKTTVGKSGEKRQERTTARLWGSPQLLFLPLLYFHPTAELKLIVSLQAYEISCPSLGQPGNEPRVNVHSS